jgi:CheY-like chemotaxis protein
MPRRSRMPRILIVDDDPDFLLICRRILEAEGFHVMEARSGSEALQ